MTASAACVPRNQEGILQSFKSGSSSLPYAQISDETLNSYQSLHLEGIHKAFHGHQMQKKSTKSLLNDLYNDFYSLLPYEYWYGEASITEQLIMIALPLAASTALQVPGSQHAFNNTTELFSIARKSSCAWIPKTRAALFR